MGLRGTVQQADIALYDFVGAAIVFVSLHLSVKGNEIKLEGLDLPSGTYLLRVSVGTETVTRKVMRH